MSQQNGAAEAVILAGGAGTRMGGAYEEAQKCLLPIEGEPILKHVLGNLALAFTKVEVTICVSHKAQEVHDFVRHNTPKGLTVNFMKDSGHSHSTLLYSSTRGVTRGPFVGAAGDVIVEPHAYAAALETVTGKDAIASLVMASDVNQVDTHALGLIENGVIADLVWPPPVAVMPGQLRDMTIWGINQQFYDYADKNPSQKAFPQLIMRALEEGQQVPAVRYDGQWLHVGYPEDLQKRLQ